MCMQKQNCYYFFLALPLMFINDKPCCVHDENESINFRLLLPAIPIVWCEIIATRQFCIVVGQSINFRLILPAIPIVQHGINFLYIILFYPTKHNLWDSFFLNEHSMVCHY